MEAKKYRYYTDNEYSEYLRRLIPLLDSKKIPTQEGAEGQVFFINDDYVVKKYHGLYTKNQVRLFDLYCQEISSFYHLRECQIPQLFSWTSVPSKKDSQSFDLYLLQERIIGKELFSDKIFDIKNPQGPKSLNYYYRVCKSFCSQEEFLTAVTNKSGALFEKITEEYIKYFLNINDKLLSMSVKNIDDFILTIFNVRRHKKFTVPDLDTSNVFFDGKKLTLIDLGWVVTMTPVLQEKEENYATMTLNDILGLFNDNRFCVNFVNKHAGTNPASRVRKLNTYNMRVCAEAVKKFVREVNKLIYPIVYADESVNIESMTEDLNGFLMPLDTKSIVDEIQRDY